MISYLKLCCERSDGSMSNLADYTADNKLQQSNSSSSHAVSNNKNDDQGGYIAKDQPLHIFDYSYFTDTEDIADDKLVKVWYNILDNDLASSQLLLDELLTVDENYILRQINAIRRTDSLQLLANNKALKVC